jgi:hypothetical protein
LINQRNDFGETAKSLARNPLGIIALFIVLVYGFASLVTAFAGSFPAGERLPLIYFLIAFPVLVLGVFAWLVSKHSGKLFAPSDFKNEDNDVKMQMSIVASLTAVAAKNDSAATEAQLHQIVEAARAAFPRVATGDGWRSHVLWVDDRPENNTYERQAFEAIGLHFTLALSTSEASERLSQNRCAAVISDMGRRERPRERYLLLDRPLTEAFLGSQKLERWKLIRVFKSGVPCLPQLPDGDHSRGSSPQLRGSWRVGQGLPRHAVGLSIPVTLVCARKPEEAARPLMLGLPWPGPALTCDALIPAV